MSPDCQDTQAKDNRAMKQWKWGLALLLFGVVGYFAFSNGCENNNDYRANILVVYASIQHSYSVIYQEEKERGQSFFPMGYPGVYENHASRIGSIDYSGCPEEFQRAFMEYARAEIDASAKIEGTQGLMTFFVNMTTGMSGVIDALQALPELKARRTKALMGMKHVAREFGIPFDIDFPDWRAILSDEDYDTVVGPMSEFIESGRFASR